MKKYFSHENIVTFVLVALACGVALVVTPKVWGWIGKKTGATP